MRIIYEIDGKHPQATVFCKHAYSTTPIHEPPSWTGARVEVLIVDVRGEGKRTQEGDAIYIEGDLDGIREAFSQVLEVLSIIEEDEQAKLEAYKARAQRCPVCTCWFDSKRLVDEDGCPGHADGRGMSCLGDGTVVLGPWNVLGVDNEGRSKMFHTSELKKGERFSFVDNDHWADVLKNHVFVALADGNQHGVLVIRPSDRRAP